jgi:Obg family GTPase CgtA
VDAFELSETEEVDVVQGRPAAPPQRLTLLLRTVADVGFVGFPNAGKSTLLNALTRARATINSYPFTTLMPNLGAMVPASSGDGSETGSGRAAPVLADLPGLVEGAHAGKGLGRAFLQQLRRVRLVLYVLDTQVCEAPIPTHAQNPEMDVAEQCVSLLAPLNLPHHLTLRSQSSPPLNPAHLRIPPFTPSTCAGS